MSQQSYDLLLQIFELKQSLEPLIEVLEEDLRQEEIRSKRVIEAMRDSLPELPQSIRNHPKHRYA
jgi:hypothetical protein